MDFSCDKFLNYKYLTQLPKCNKYHNTPSMNCDNFLAIVLNYKYSAQYQKCNQNQNTPSMSCDKFLVINSSITNIQCSINNVINIILLRP